MLSNHIYVISNSEFIVCSNNEDSQATYSRNLQLFQLEKIS